MRLRPSIASFLGALAVVPLLTAAMTEEAQRYHGMLLKRPQPGAIFERFVDEWLETGSTESLLQDLVARAKAPKATAADHLILALLQARMGRDVEAIASYSAALERDPGNASGWLEKARLQARMQEFDTALASLDRAVAASPDGTLAMEIGKTRARYLVRTGKPAEALQVFRDLLAAHPGDTELAEDVIWVQTEEGLYDEASTQLKALLSRTKDAHQRITFQLQLADIALRREQRDEAIALHVTALEATGQDTWVEGEILARLESIYRHEDDVAGLSRKLGELAAAHPQRTALALTQSRVAADLGDNEGAVKIFRGILARTPGGRSLREQFIDLLERTGHKKEAVEQTRALADLNRDDRELRVRLASLQYKADDLTAAQAALDEFLAMKGALEGDHLRVARLLEQWGLNDAARAAYERMIKAHPDSIGARESQAHFLHRIGDRDAAIVVWRDIAAKGTVEDVLRTAQALLARGEAREAEDILLGRKGDFDTQTRFLALLAETALLNKDFATAVPAARARLRLSEEAELEDSLRGAVNAIEVAKQRATVMAELAKTSTLTLQDRCLLAFLQEAQGQTGAAEKTLQDAEGKQRLPAQEQLSRLYSGRAQWGRAAEVTEALFAMQGGKTGARAQRLAYLWNRAEQPEKALSFVTEWKRLLPGAAQPWLEESGLLLQLGRQEDALGVLRSAARKFDNDSTIASTLARTCMEAGRSDEAERVYLALYEKTQDPLARLRLLGPMALAAQANNRLDPLIARFSDRQKLNRASAVPWLALAEIHRATGNEEERRRCLYEASRLRPEDLDLLLEIARCEEECGLVQESLRTLASAAKLDRTPATKQRMAKIQIEQGDHEKGYQLLFEIAGGDAMDARGAESLALAMVQRSGWERAREFLDPLLTDHPDDYRLHLLHAIALQECNREKQALHALVRVAGMQKELPGVQSQGRVTMPYLPFFGDRDLPEGTEDLLLIQQAYLANKGAAFAPNQPLASQGPWHVVAEGVVMPADVTSLPLLALARLIPLAQSLSEDDQKFAAAKLAQQGMVDADLLLRLDLTSSNDALIPEDLLEKYPGHTALHVTWFVSTFGKVTSSRELLPRTWKMVEETHPGLAFGIAQTAFRRDQETYLPLLKKSIDRLKTAGDVPPDTLLTLCEMLTGSIGGTSLPDDLQSSMVTVLREHAVRASVSQPHLVAECLLALELVHQWADLIAILEQAQEAERKTRRGTAAHVLTPIHYYASGSEQPPFPIRALDLSPHLAPFLLGGSGRVTSPRFDSAHAFNVFSEEIAVSLKPHVAAVKDARLRLVLQLLTGDLAGVEAYLAPRLSRSDTTLADWELAAWLAHTRGDSSKAAVRYAKACAMETDPATLATMDFVLLGYAKEANPSDKNTVESLRPALKTTFERLESAGWAVRNQMTDIEAMAKDFGMMEEFAKLDAAVIAEMRAPRPSGGLPPPNPYAMSRQHAATSYSLGQAVILASEGKKAEASREAVGALRHDAREWLAHVAGGSPFEATLRHSEIDTTLEKSGILQETLQAITPQPAASWREHQEHGIILEYLAKKAEARAAYERAIAAAGQRGTFARARILSLLMGEDEEGMVRQMESMPARELEALLPSLSKQLGPIDAQDRFESRLWFARLFTRYLDHRADSGVPLEENLIKAFRQGMLLRLTAGEGYPGNTFKGLLEPEPLSQPEKFAEVTITPSEDYAAKGRESRAKLRIAFDALCQAYLRHPGLAGEAFPPLAALALAEKKDTASLEALAIKLIEQQAAGKSRHPWDPRFRSDVLLALPSPTDFLVRRMAAARGAELEEKVISLVAASGGAAAGDEARAYARLFTCEEGGFLEAAQLWLQAFSQHARRPRFEEEGSFREVVNIWEERGFRVPLDSLVLKRPPAESRTLDAPVDAVIHYANLLGERAGAGALVRFAQALRDDLLGADPAARRVMVAAWAKTNTVDWLMRGGTGTIGRTKKVDIWAQWLMRLLLLPHDQVLLPLALEDGLQEGKGWAMWASEQLSQPTTWQTPEGIVRQAELLGFLDEAPTLRARLVGSHMRDDLHHTWMETLAFQAGEHSKETFQILEHRKPRTLGVELFLILMEHPVPQEGTVTKPALAELVQRRAADLRLIPPAQRAEFAAIMRRRFPGFPHLTLLGPELSKALAPLLENDFAKMEQQLDRFIASTTASQAQVVLPEFRTQLAVQLDVAAPALPAKSEAALRHALTLLRTTKEYRDAVRKGASAGQMMTFLDSFARATALFPQVLAVADQEGLTNNPRWGYMFATSMVGAKVLGHEGMMRDIFLRGPFAADAKSFRDLRIYSPRQPTLLGLLVEEARKNDATRLRGILAAHTPQTFGTKLVHALLEEDDALALGAFLAAHQEELKQLGTDAATDLLALVHKRIPSDKRPTVAAALDILHAANVRRVDAVVQRWQAAQVFPEPGMLIDTDGVPMALELLDHLARRDRKRAEAFLDHAATLFLNGWEPTNDGSLMGQPVASLLRRVTGIPELFGAAMSKADSYALTQDQDWLIEALENAAAVFLDEQEDPARVVTMLGACGLLGDPQDFRLHLIPKGEGNVSLLSLFVAESALPPREPLKLAVMEILEARTSKTFGEDLVLALLKPERATLLPAVLKKHAAGLAKMPERRQRSVIEVMLLHGATLDQMAAAAPELNRLIMSVLLDRATK